MTQPPVPDPAQQPTPQGQHTPQPPVTPTPAAPRRRGAVVVAAVVGVLLGAAGVGGAWLLTSGSGEDGAEADVRLACELVGKTPEIVMDSDDLSDMYRWGAASTLALAAAEADPSYEELSKKLQKPVFVVQRNFDAGGPEYEQAMRDAQAACADL